MQSLKEGRGQPGSGVTPGLEMTMSLSGPPGFNHQHTTVPTDSLFHYMNRQQQQQQQQQQQSQSRSSSASRSGSAADSRVSGVESRPGPNEAQALPPHHDPRLMSHNEVIARMAKEEQHHHQGLMPPGSRNHQPHSHPPPLHPDNVGPPAIHHKDSQLQGSHEHLHSQKHQSDPQIHQHLPNPPPPHGLHQAQHHHHLQQHPQHPLPPQHPHQLGRHYSDQRVAVHHDGRSSVPSSRMSRDLSGGRAGVHEQSPKESRMSGLPHHDHLQSMYQAQHYLNQQPAVPTSSKSVLSPHSLSSKQISAMSAPSHGSVHSVGPNASQSFGLVPVSSKPGPTVSSGQAPGLISSVHPSLPGHPDSARAYFGAKGVGGLHPEDQHKLMMASANHYQMDMMKAENQQHSVELAREQRIEYRDSQQYAATASSRTPHLGKPGQDIHSHRVHESVLSRDMHAVRRSGDHATRSSIMDPHTSGASLQKASPFHPDLVHAANHSQNADGIYRGSGSLAALPSPHLAVGGNQHHMLLDQQGSRFNSPTDPHMSSSLPHNKSQSVIKNPNLTPEEADWRRGAGAGPNKLLISPGVEDSRLASHKPVGSLHPSASASRSSLHMPFPPVMQGSISTGQPRLLPEATPNKAPGHKPPASQERHTASLERRQAEPQGSIPTRPPHNTDGTGHKPDQEKQLTRMSGTPLDLTKLHQPPAKAHDAPLDLTVKTKKRLSDVTMERSTPEFDRMLSAAKRPKIDSRSSQSALRMPAGTPELYLNSSWTAPMSPRLSDNFDPRTAASPAYSSHTPSPASHKALHQSNGRASSDSRYHGDGRSSVDSHVSLVSNRSGHDSTDRHHSGVSQAGLKYGKAGLSANLPDMMKNAASNPQMVPLTTQLQKVREEQAYRSKIQQGMNSSHAPNDSKSHYRDGTPVAPPHVDLTQGNSSEMVVVRHHQQQQQQQQQQSHVLPQVEYEHQHHAQMLHHQHQQQQQQQHHRHSEQQQQQQLLKQSPQAMQPLHIDARHHTALPPQQQASLPLHLLHHQHLTPPNKPSPVSKSQQDYIELAMKDSSDPLQASRTGYPPHPEQYAVEERIRKQQVFVNQHFPPSKKEQLSPYDHAQNAYPKTVGHAAGVNSQLYGKKYIPASSQPYSPNTQNQITKQEDIERFYHQQQQMQLQQQQQQQQHQHQQQQQLHKQQLLDAKGRPQATEAFKQNMALSSLGPTHKWPAPALVQQRQNLSRKDQAGYNHNPEYLASKYNNTSTRQKPYSRMQNMNYEALRYGYVKEDKNLRGGVDPTKGGASLALPAGGVREESRRALSRRISISGSGCSSMQAVSSEHGRIPELIRKDSLSSLPEGNSRPDKEASKVPGSIRGSNYPLKQRSSSSSSVDIGKRVISADEEASRVERELMSAVTAPPVSASQTMPLKQGDDKSNPIDISTFSSPLTVSIPQSPIALVPSPMASPLPALPSSTPATMQGSPPAVPTPTARPGSTSHKVWSRKQMILNAVNQDESLKRTLGSAGGKHEAGGISTECKSRIMATSTGSPIPASPKMPILSPHEDEGEGIREEQHVRTPVEDDDLPPTLDPPIKGRLGKPASSRAFSHGQPQAGGRVTAVVESPLACSNGANGTTGNAPKMASVSAAGGAVGSNNSTGVFEEGVEDSSGNSVVIRRCSIGGVPPEGPQPLQPLGTEDGAKTLSSNTSTFQRSEVIRRNSLTGHVLNDRPWGHLKNIPIANVAPFVHSRSDEEKNKNQRSESPAGNGNNPNNINNNSISGTNHHSTDPVSGSIISGRGISPHSQNVSPTEKTSPDDSNPNSKQSPGLLKPKNPKSSVVMESSKEMKESGKEEAITSILATSSSDKVLVPKKKKVAKLRVSSPTKLKDLELISPNLEYTVLKSSQIDELKVLDRLSDHSSKKILATRPPKYKPKMVKDKTKSKRVVKKRIRYVFDDEMEDKEEEEEEEEKEAAPAPLLMEEEEEEDEDQEEEMEGKEGGNKKDPKMKARDREERALRRGQLREQSDESPRKQRGDKTSQKRADRSEKTVTRSGNARPASRITRRRFSSTNQKAQELKHNAMVQRRLTGKRNIRGYNRSSAACEQDVHREAASRHTIVRAKRQASNKARERLQQHRDHSQERDDAGDEEEDRKAYAPSWEVQGARGGGGRKVGAGGNNNNNSTPHHKANHNHHPQQHHNSGGGGGKMAAGKSNTAPSTSRKEDYESDVEDIPEDLAEEMAASKGKRRSKGKAKVSRQKTAEKAQAGDTNAACPDGTDGTARGEDSLYADTEPCEENTTPQIPIENVPVPADVKKLSINKNSGETLLHRAARLGHEDITLYCLKTQTVPVNARDNAGYTPLHESCVRGSIAVARHLIYYGADVNCCSQDGIRPIHDAIENDHVELVCLLLAHGADPLIATYAGRTPVRIANSFLMLKTLQGYTTDLNGVTDCGEEEEEEQPVELPWRFTSTMAFYECRQERGYSPWVDLPVEPTDDSNDVFDDGHTSAVNVFNLAIDGEEHTPQPFCLMEDVLHRLGLQNKEKLGALFPWDKSSIRLPSERVREVASCCCSNVSIRLPQSGSVTLLPFSTLKGIEQALIERGKLRVDVMKDGKLVKEEQQQHRGEKSSSSSSSSSSLGKDVKVAGVIQVKKEKEEESVLSQSPSPAPTLSSIVTTAKPGHRHGGEKCSPLEKGLGDICLKEETRKSTTQAAAVPSVSKSKSFPGDLLSSSSSPLLSSSSSSPSSLSVSSAMPSLTHSDPNCDRGSVKDGLKSLSFSFKSQRPSSYLSSHHSSSWITQGTSSSSSSSSHHSSRSSSHHAQENNSHSHSGSSGEHKRNSNAGSSSSGSGSQGNNNHHHHHTQHHSSSSSSHSHQHHNSHNYNNHHHQQHQHHHHQPQHRAHQPQKHHQSYASSASSLHKHPHQPYGQHHTHLAEKRPHSAHISSSSSSSSSSPPSAISSSSPLSSSTKLVTSSSKPPSAVSTMPSNPPHRHKYNKVHAGSTLTTTASANATTTNSDSSVSLNNNKNMKSKNQPASPPTLLGSSGGNANPITHSRHAGYSTSSGSATPPSSRKTKRDTPGPKAVESGWGSNPMFSDDSSSSPFHSATIDCLDSDSSP